MLSVLRRAGRRSLVTGPEGEPITLDDAKRQVRRVPEDTSDDTYLTSLLATARGAIERLTQRAMLTQTWELLLDGFPCEGYIELPLPPLQTVNSIQYRDMNGNWQTLAADQYEVEAPAGPQALHGRITPAYAVVWPPTYLVPGCVKVSFSCGYGAEPSDVPGELRQAMLVELASRYENREEGIDGKFTPTHAVEDLAGPFIVDLA